MVFTTVLATKTCASVYFRSIYKLALRLQLSIVLVDVFTVNICRCFDRWLGVRSTRQVHQDVTKLDASVIAIAKVHRKPKHVGIMV